MMCIHQTRGDDAAGHVQHLTARYRARNDNAVCAMNVRGDFTRGSEKETLCSGEGQHEQ